MPSKRLVRVNELLKQEVAAALYRVMNEKAFDLSVVTVTNVIVSSDLRTARVLVSIRDHEADRDQILGQLRHHRGAIQHLMSKAVILKYTPVLSFELDESIEQGDHVLQLISKMEAEHILPEEPPPAVSPAPDDTRDAT